MSAIVHVERVVLLNPIVICSLRFLNKKQQAKVLNQGFFLEERRF